MLDTKLTTADTQLTPQTGVTDTQVDNQLTPKTAVSGLSIDNQNDNQLCVSDVAKLLKLSRGTLYNRIKASDIHEGFKSTGVAGNNNAIYYPQSAWVELLSDVGLALPEQPEQSEQNTADAPVTPSNTSITPTSITVVGGNHRNTLAAPQFPTEFNLGSMRSELATVNTHEDPLALAERFINGADSLMDAMAEDEKALARNIAETRQARQAVGRKVDQLKRRNDIYSLRTELLADRQNVETAALNEDISVLQSMGNGGSGQ